MKRLVLASSSPRRATLLQSIGLPFTQVEPKLDEQPLPNETASNLVMRLARAKAEAGLASARTAFPELALSDLVVLAADTVIELKGETLGKPSSRPAGVKMLMQLAGREHSVVTGFCLLSPATGASAPGQQQGLLSCEAVTSRVRFRPFSQAEAEAYWATGEPHDKAGSYGIQGRGSIFVEHIEGSYTNVVGLPLTELHAALVKHGISCLDAPAEAMQTCNRGHES